MNTNGQSTKPLEWFVNSLLQSTGQIELIVQHMLRFAAGSEDQSVPSIDETLHQLFTDVLRKELDRDPAEYAAAAVLLAEVRKVIESEVCLVEPGAFDDLDPDELESPPPADDAEDAA